MPGFGRTLGTKTRNLAVSHTHTFGTSLLNEFRFGWMRVDGGQASLNAGVDFAGQVGLAGVTRDPRDVGFPQISTRGLYSTMGDPTSFVFRHNQHFELYDNFTVDRGAHRFKFGGYYFHLRLRPEQPDNARGAFTYTGQFSGNAFADFLLGYPTSATSGIGRGDEDGRTNWLHLYAQDDWRMRDNLTVNVGLRYEYNQHMYDVNNRLSSIDLSAPGGRFVVASDDNGNISPDAQALLPLIPISYVTSAEAGWGRGLLDPSAVRLAPRTGFALTSTTQSRRPRRVRHLPEPVGLQRANGVRAESAFFLHQTGRRPGRRQGSHARTRDILTSNPTGTIGASIMDHAYNVEYSQTWSGGLQYELFPSTMIEVSYMGTWTLGADNATVRNVPEPGPGSIQSRRPIPQLSRINAIRFDGKSIYHGVTFKVERRLRNNYAYNVSYTLSTSKDDASSPGATESEANVPQNVRNIFDESGEWAHSSFDHRHQFVASGVYELPFFVGAGGFAEAAFGGWRVNAISSRSRARPSPSTSASTTRISAPARRSDPISSRIPTAGGRSNARAMVQHVGLCAAGAVYLRQRAAQQRDWAGIRQRRSGHRQDVELAGASQLEFRWEIFNAFNRANFDIPNRIFGTPNFGRIFSAKNPREMQFGAKVTFFQSPDAPPRHPHYNLGFLRVANGTRRLQTLPSPALESGA